MSYDLFIVDKDVPEPEWFDVCERDGEHVRGPALMAVISTTRIIYPRFSPLTRSILSMTWTG